MNIDGLSVGSLPSNKSKNQRNNNSKLLGSESQELYDGYMEFRKKGYWNQKSEHAQKVEKFMRKMKKKRKEVQHVH